jgi:hypothetical protein
VASGGLIFVKSVRIYFLLFTNNTNAEAKDISSILCVQTSSEARPASYPMGTGGPFPGDKARPGRDADISLHLMPSYRMNRSYSVSPSWSLHGGSGTALLSYKKLPFGIKGLK